MKHREIAGIAVSAIGLGAMPMSLEGRPDRVRAAATIHAALDAGVTLIDTADAYHRGADDAGRDERGHNEVLVTEALRSWAGDSGDVLVATKGGHLRQADGSWVLDGRPEHIKRAAKDSARRLGVDAIGLLQHHRPDPDVPYAETIGALAELLDEGTIRAVGISNADEGQIRLAHDVLGGRLAAVQNQFSPAFRSSEPEIGVCAELGVAFLPWSPLGGMGGASELGTRHRTFAEVATEHEVSPQQVCLAWELALSSVVIPIPGASRPASIRSSAGAVDLELSPDEVARLSRTGT